MGVTPDRAHPSRRAAAQPDAAPCRPGVAAMRVAPGAAARWQGACSLAVPGREIRPCC